MDRYPHLIEDTEDPEDTEAVGPISRPTRGRIGTRVGGSLATTVAGVFLVGALAFGANLQATSAPASIDDDAVDLVADLETVRGDRGHRGRSYRRDASPRCQRSVSPSTCSASPSRRCTYRRR